jgi:hypothetical protein
MYPTLYDGKDDPTLQSVCTAQNFHHRRIKQWPATMNHFSRA